MTLFVAGAETEAVRTRLEESADQLRADGVETETRVEGGSPFAALREAVPGHDVVVLGERAPSLTSVLFGEEADRIAATSVSPVLPSRPTTRRPRSVPRT